MVRLISRQRGGLAALKLTELFGTDDFPAVKDSGKVLIIIIYCYLIIIIIIIIIIIPRLTIAAHSSSTNSINLASVTDAHGNTLTSRAYGFKFLDSPMQLRKPQGLLSLSCSVTALSTFSCQHTTG